MVQNRCLVLLSPTLSIDFPIATTDAQLEKPGIEESIGIGARPYTIYIPRLDPVIVFYSWKGLRVAMGTNAEHCKWKPIQASRIHAVETTFETLVTLQVL